jgi:hypothetical protein
VPLALSKVPAVPKSPPCYASVHPDRIERFPEEEETFINPRKLTNQPQEDHGWRHELEHDAESVFWLLLYWAMVVQPETLPGEEFIDAPSWALLLNDSNHRHNLIKTLCSEDASLPDNLTHSRYKSLQPLISKLAAILVVDRHWLPASDVRNHPEYLNEAFQRSILQFILDNRDEKFMKEDIGPKFRKVAAVAQSQGLSSTRNEVMNTAEREAQRRLTTGNPEVGCVCGPLNSCPFLFLCSQGEDMEVDEAT